MGVTSLDNKAALIIVNDFLGSGGDADYCNFTLSHSKSFSSVCIVCKILLTFWWKKSAQSPNASSVFLPKKFAMSAKKRGSNTGAQCWKGVITPWRKVSSALEPCVSILPLTVSLCLKQPLNSCKKPKRWNRRFIQHSSTGIRDIVHTGKYVHRSHCNWLMFIKRARLSLVMLCHSMAWLILLKRSEGCSERCGFERPITTSHRFKCVFLKWLIPLDVVAWRLSLFLWHCFR